LLISKLYQDATLLLQFEKFFWPKLTPNIWVGYFTTGILFLQPVHKL
jgi:hypothetical protein